MPFRDIGQGKRCRLGAELDARRHHTTSQDERLELAREKVKHVNEVKIDRQVNTRGNAASEYFPTFVAPTAQRSERLFRAAIASIAIASIAISKHSHSKHSHSKHSHSHRTIRLQ